VVNGVPGSNDAFLETDQAVSVTRVKGAIVLVAVMAADVPRRWRAVACIASPVHR
jgi:hypothetical protein